MNGSKVIVMALLAAGLATPTLANVLIEDWSTGNLHMGSVWAGYIPVPVGASVTVDVAGPGIIGGLRRVTLFKAMGSDYSPTLDQWPAGSMMTYNSAFNNHSTWSVSYGAGGDLNSNFIACGADRIRLGCSYQLDTNADGGGADGTPCTVTVVSGAMSVSHTRMLFSNPNYLIGQYDIDWDFLFTDFPGINFADVDRISFSFVQNGANQAVDYGIRSIYLPCDGQVDADELPAGLQLAANYPNPFNPTTSIAYSVSETSTARLTVSDILGRHVATLVDGLVERGSHRVTFDAHDLPSGVYFYTLQAEGRTLTQKMLLMK